MKRILLTITVLLFGIAITQAQTIITLSADQPSKLEAHAGSDTATFLDDPVTLGDNPAAVGGTEPYSCIWSNGNSFISTEANPSVYPSENTTYILTVIDSSMCIATDEISISIDFTGIDDLYGKALRIYPNPTTHRFTVEHSGTDCLISLVNEKGIRLWTKPLGGKASFVAPSTPGIYFLRIDDGEKELVRRVVVSK